MTRDWKICLMICCSLAAAATPVAAPAQGDGPGRLFFTPAQRASLDVARSQRARAALSTEKTEQEAAPAVPQTITYGGMVRRSDGKSTVWFNNQPVNDREPLGGVAIVGRVGADGSVTLQVPQSGRSVSLKPGQSVELLSGAIGESYSRAPAAEPEPKPAPKPAAKPAADAKSAKPAAPEAAAQREREERETQRLEDAISRALTETASARPGAAPGPGATATK